MNSSQHFEDWYDDHQYGLEELFIEKNDSDFTHWCMMCNREPDCPDAMSNYIEAENDRFWEFVKTQYTEETQ